jgi:deoxycytidylate deaminase
MVEEKYLTLLEKVAITVPANDRVRSFPRAKLAACVVYKNDIVSFGVNQLKSHPFQAKFSRHEDAIFLHAETDAIKNALRTISIEELSKSTLYVCRVKYHDVRKKQYLRGMSCPCDGCKKAIATFNIKKVVYTCDDGTFEYL